MILALRTDTAETTLLLLSNDGKLIVNDTWGSGRQLSGELLPHIEQLLLKDNNGWEDLTGLIIFRGPGSFTGLRIGCSVANAIAYAQNIPIVGSKGEDWIVDALNRFENGDNDQQVLPFYGAQPNISKPRGSA